MNKVELTSSSRERKHCELNEIITKPFDFNYSCNNRLVCPAGEHLFDWSQLFYLRPWVGCEVNCIICFFLHAIIICLEHCSLFHVRKPGSRAWNGYRHHFVPLLLNPWLPLSRAGPSVWDKSMCLMTSRHFRHVHFNIQSKKDVNAMKNSVEMMKRPAHVLQMSFRMQS